MKTIAIYPGSFDPITKGHIDIIEKSSRLFDFIYVVVANNQNKKHLLSIEDRFSLVKESIKNFKNVEPIILENGNTVSNFSKTVNGNIMVRGIRNSIDLEYEFSIEEFTKVTNPDIETIYFSPKKEHMFTSSSLVRNLILNGYVDKINDYVSREVFLFFQKYNKD